MKRGKQCEWDVWKGRGVNKSAVKTENQEKRGNSGFSVHDGNVGKGEKQVVMS